jgi:hypothetical protein
MQIISKNSGALPRTYRLDGVHQISSEVVGQGGYAEIYRGLYRSKPVSLKVIKVTKKASKKQNEFDHVSPVRRQ